MRILHVFDHSLPLQSGYVTRSLGIIRAQRARGWDTIHLTTPRQGSSAGREETIDGLTFHRTRGARPIMPVVNELREMRATRRELESLVQKSRPDIIHAHSPVLNAIPALGAGRRLGIPVVYEARAFWEDAAVDHGTTREHSVRYRVSRWLDTRTMRRAGHVVAICEPMRQEMVGRGLDATG